MQKKSRPSYTVMQNLRFMLLKIWKWDKSMIALGVIAIPGLFVLPLLSIYLSKYVVEIVTLNQGIENLLVLVCSISFLILVFNVIDSYCTNLLSSKSVLIRYKYINLCSEKIMDTDYSNIESYEGQGNIKRAIKLMDAQKLNNPAGRSAVGAQAIVSVIVKLLSSLFGIISYGIIIFRLNPIIILIVTVCSLASFYFDKKFNDFMYSTRSIWRPIDEIINYVKRALGDASRGKDVVLYNIKNWMEDYFQRTLNLRKVWHYKQFRRHFASEAACSVASLVRDLLTFGILLWYMAEKNLPISDFVLYFGIISGFGEVLLNLIFSAQSIYATSLEFCDFRDFLDMKDQFSYTEGKTADCSKYEVELSNVSFKYTSDGENVLKNINLHIENGEKLAIVGVNGAGKTTLVKLLCGFYKATDGDIKINGINVDEYNHTSYFSQFFAVFQDIFMLPVSIAKNIAMCSEKDIDTAKVERCLREVGLWDKVEHLPDKANTKLGKNVFEDAIELSGGEKQKLALARALYKGGSIVILDEPTAALDPIAENELYLKYNELTRGKTSIFISHRLSSTRFCDRIIMVENGEITEIGSHDELMAAGNTYAKMFELQSSYYVGGEAECL